MSNTNFSFRKLEKLCFSNTRKHTDLSLDRLYSIFPQYKEHDLDTAVALDLSNRFYFMRARNILKYGLCPKCSHDTSFFVIRDNILEQTMKCDRNGHCECSVPVRDFYSNLLFLSKGIKQ